MPCLRITLRSQGTSTVRIEAALSTLHVADARAASAPTAGRSTRRKEPFSFTFVVTMIQNSTHECVVRIPSACAPPNSDAPRSSANVCGARTRWRRTPSRLRRRVVPTGFARSTATSTWTVVMALGPRPPSALCSTASAPVGRGSGWSRRDDRAPKASRPTSKSTSAMRLPVSLSRLTATATVDDSLTSAMRARRSGSPTMGGRFGASSTKKSSETVLPPQGRSRN